MEEEVEEELEEEEEVYDRSVSKCIKVYMFSEEEEEEEEVKCMKLYENL